MKIFFALVVMTSSVAFGRTSETVAIVRMMSVQKQSKDLKSATDAFSEKMKDLGKEFELYKKTAEAEMKKAQSLAQLKPDAFEKKKAEMEKNWQEKIGDLQARETALRKELDQASLTFQEKCSNAIKNLSKEKSITLVFDQGMLLYSDSSVPDITDDIIKKLDSASSKG